MIESYNAFISYRHVERDIRVAEEIQNQLEHYKIPKAITEKTGVKKIERIFRDKSELPITANLTDDIQNALRNSEFLIVICSPEMLESLWCRREIELFLETHPHEHILTVLSSGEPYNAIPDLLLTREIHTVDSEGNPVVINEQVEPLSCDYRLPLKRARREELPRLAAALIGCSYDELVQRANQYRLRKWRITAAAVGTASAMAVSYLVWSNMQIKKNLEQSQKNMSLYLAEESLDALADQDRIKAIQLALEALPAEGNDKPVITEAEFALAEATGIYKLPGPLEYSAVSRIETDYKIRDFLISPDREILAVVDNENNIYLFHSNEDQPFHKEKMDDYSILLSGFEKGFYVSMNDHTLLLDWHDGHVIWENSDPCQYRSLGVQEDSDFVSKWTVENLRVIDDKGNTVDTLAVPDLKKGYNLDSAVLNASGTRALLSFVDWDRSFTVSADLETDEITILMDDMGFTDYMAYLDDGSAIVCEMVNGMNEISEPSIYDFYSVFSMTSNIYRINPDTHEILWKTALSFSQEGYYRNFEQMEYADENGNLHHGLLCNLSNVQALINLEDGSVFKKTEWPSVVKNTIAKNTDNVFSLLSDGTLGVNGLTDNYSNGLHAFVSDAKKALLFNKNEGRMGDVLVLPEDKPYIIRYVAGLTPDGYRRLDNTFAPVLTSSIIHSDRIALDWRDQSYTRHVSVFDTESEEMLADYTVDTYEDPHFSFSEDGKKFYLISGRSLTLTEKDLETGEESVTDIIPEEILLPETLSEVKGNAVHYICRSVSLETGTLLMGSYDYVNQTSVRTEIVSHEGWQTGMGLQRCVFSEDGRYCLLETDTFGKESEKNELYYLRLDQDSPQAVKLKASDDEFYPGTFNSSATAFALAENSEIHIFNRNAEQTGTIPFKQDSFLSAAYLDDELYLLTNEETVYRYSAENELLSTLEAGLYSNSRYSKSDRYNWVKEGSNVWLNADGVLTILDIEKEGTRVFITGLLGINSGEHTALVADASKRLDGTSVGIMPVYSIEELITIGNSIVQDYTTEEP